VVAFVMGGSGKSVTAAAVARDKEVRTRFEKICFIPVGQAPQMRELHRMLHVQLCDGNNLDSSLMDDDACFHVLHVACQGKSVHPPLPPRSNLFEP
jgi:hypothetical protein